MRQKAESTDTPQKSIGYNPIVFSRILILNLLQIAISNISGLLEGVPFSESAICIADFRGLYEQEENLPNWFYRFATAVKIFKGKKKSRNIAPCISPESFL